MIARKFAPLSFLIALLSLAACQPQTRLEVIRWDAGQDRQAIDAKIKSVNYGSTQATNSAGELISFQEQTLNGAVVENSYLKRLNSSTGEEVLISGALSFENEKLNSLNLKPFESSRATVIENLRERIPAFRTYEITRLDLIISKHQGFHEPLWRVTYFDRYGVPWELKMNNHFQIRSVSRVGSQFHDTFAVVYPKGPKLSALSEVVLKDLKTQPALSNQRLSVFSQAESKIDIATETLKFNPQDTRFDQVQVFYFLDESLNWFEKQLGVKIPFQLQAEVHIGNPDKTNTAFYYQGKIRLGAGDDISYSRIPQDASIVIHESVHALVEAVARLPYEGEGGSINEAYADFFTALQIGSPNMGESAYLKGPFRRTINNNYKLSDRRGTLYFDSGIISGTLWELRQKLGPEKARRIALRTLNRLTPVSNFVDFGAELKGILQQELQGKELATGLEILRQRGF